MKRKELKAIAKEYARAVYRAWELEKSKRDRIDKRTAQLEKMIDEAGDRAMAAAEECLLQNKNEAEELKKLVDELIGGNNYGIFQ